MHGNNVFFDLMVLLGSAAFTATIFHMLKLPVIVGFLVAGAIIGPTGLGIIKLDANPTLLTEIAGVLLMFTLGLEFSAKRLREWGKKIIGLGIPQVLLTVLVVAVCARYGFDQKWPRAFFWGFLFSLSSTAVIIKLLEEHRDIESPHGATTLSVLLTQDLFVVPMLLLVPFLAGRIEPNVDEMDTLKFIGKAIVLIVGMIVLARWVLPHVLTRVARTKSRELLIFTIAFLCFALAVLFNLVGASSSLGAFFAGVVIAESQYGSQASNDFAVARDLFLGFFFTALGMMLNLDYFVSHLPIIFGVFIGVSLLKICIVYGVMRSQKFPNGISWLTAGVLFQTGEFSFILSEQGLRYNLITKEHNQLFLSASLLSLAATPFIFKALLKKFSGVSSDSAGKDLEGKWQNHVIIAGFGVAAKTVLKATRSHGIQSVVIDLNPDNKTKAEHMAEAKIFGDARQTEVWHKACAHGARLAIITVSGQGMAAQVVKAVREVAPNLPIIVRTQYFRESINKAELRGADVVVAESEAAIEVTRKALNVLGASQTEIAARLQVLRTELRLDN